MSACAILDSGAPPERRGTRVRLPAAGESRLAGFAYVPERAAPGAPLLVAVHGIARDAHELALSFEPLAETRGWVLLAPEFDAVRHGDYQRLGRVGRGARADHALEALIDSVGRRFGLSPSGPRLLFGHSAGGQFVHRYWMAHPERVQAAAVSAPGWFTFPDPEVPYPLGLRVGRELPGLQLSPRAFLRRPVLAVVGERDVERDPSLRRSRRIDRRQGRHRLARARRWVEALNAAAARRGLPPPARLHRVAGAGHDFRDVWDSGLRDVVEPFFCEAVARFPVEGPAVAPPDTNPATSGPPLDEETT